MSEIYYFTPMTYNDDAAPTMMKFCPSRTRMVEKWQVGEIANDVVSAMCKTAAGPPALEFKIHMHYL
jgi:hypothetical protein